MDVASAAGMATVGALRAEAVDVVVFDLDGVLTDTAELHAAAWKQAFDADSDYRTHVNGYLGTRGAVPECAADGVHYPGSYLAGVYNRLRTAVDDHTLEHEHLVNVPDWLPLRFRVEGGDWFSPDTAELTVYRTELDLRNGVLTRVLRFRDAQGRHTAVRQRRLVHMDDPHLAALETVFTAEDWSGGLEVRCGIDGTVVNANLPEDEPLARRTWNRSRPRPTVTRPCSRS